MTNTCMFKCMGICKTRRLSSKVTLPFRTEVPKHNLIDGHGPKVNVALFTTTLNYISKYFFFLSHLYCFSHFSAEIKHKIKINNNEDMLQWPFPLVLYYLYLYGMTGQIKDHGSWFGLCRISFISSHSVMI